MVNESSLSRKLRIKPAFRVLLINAPETYPSQLEPLPAEVQLHFSAESEYDVVQLFVKDGEELGRALVWLGDHLREDTVLWITYPKKSSGISTDLGMMESWEQTSKYGLSAVASAAIDNVWTALRFKPASQVKRSVVRNSVIKANEFGEYVDVERRTIRLPEDLKQELQGSVDALAFFEGLSYTNKKEYVLWILTAKQEKTRRDRVLKTVEKLKLRLKNPSEKQIQ